jgi:geranylgeranyl diphosphate synthase type II
MTRPTQTPLGDHRARVHEYLRAIEIPFDSVAGTIVRERLADELGDDGLRPSLVLWACTACGGADADALPIAASVYLFERFMVLHDELVEERPSDRWGLGQSLNAGDALYALAFHTLSRDVVDAARRLGAADVVARGVLEAIEGRNEDLQRRAQPGTTLAYARSIRRRSAALTAAALCAGAVAAGAPEPVQRTFARAGRLLAGAAAINDPRIARRVGDKAVDAVHRCLAGSAPQRAFEEAVTHVARRVA